MKYTVCPANADDLRLNLYTYHQKRRKEKKKQKKKNTQEWAIAHSLLIRF
jgi:hypothetical protein